MTYTITKARLARWVLPVLAMFSTGAVASNLTSLTVADQQESVRVLLDASGVGATLPFKPQFADFAGGPAILEAFRAGAVDVGIVRSIPPIQAQAAGEKVLVIAALVSDNPAYQLAIRPTITVNKLADLKGKKIAYAEGTARQAFILAALQQAGLSPRDVQLIPLRVNDFFDAINTGQVDVAPMLDPQFSRYVGDDDRQARFVSQDLLASLPRDILYLYASDRALTDPQKREALQAFAKVWVEGSQWAEKHPEQWAQAYYVKQLQLKPEDARRIVSAQGRLSVPKLQSMIPIQQDLVNLLHAAGELPVALDAKEEFYLGFEPDAVADTAVVKGKPDAH